MKIEDLKPAPYNPRVMNEKASRGLKRSLKEFGDLSGITYNKTTGNLITGHHRVLGLKEIWGDKLIFKMEGEEPGLACPNGDWYPIRIVEWDKMKEMAANITANNTGIQGRFTDELQPLLWKLKESLSQTFSELKLDSLVKHAKTRISQTEIEFSEVLNECNNYVVLTFSNTIDWLSAMTHFELKTKVSQRANGKPWSHGIGRVIDGAKYLKKLSSN